MRKSQKKKEKKKKGERKKREKKREKISRKKTPPFHRDPVAPIQIGKKVVSWV